MTVMFCFSLQRSLELEAESCVGSPVLYQLIEVTTVTLYLKQEVQPFQPFFFLHFVLQKAKEILTESNIPHGNCVICLYGFKVTFSFFPYCPLTMSIWKTFIMVSHLLLDCPGGGVVQQDALLSLLPLSLHGSICSPLGGGDTPPPAGDGRRQDGHAASGWTTASMTSPKAVKLILVLGPHESQIDKKWTREMCS